EQLRAQIALPSSSQTDASTPAPASEAGFSGQISDMERYKEKLFVDSEARVMMSTWTNPF
ncbi:MAG: hypothetical protein M3007_07840, partial [Candidatus Eremiobacteraeota bacterium]|nr:hypothetical protein [Candidatus Eremiobacteraeota bacterium]